MSIRSVERAMRVLQEMNMQPYTSIAHLHARTGLPKATLVRILQTLEGLGFVENDQRLGGYQVSALVNSLSSGFHKEPLVVEAGRAWAIAITRQHQWPVSISCLDRDAVVVRFSTVPDSSVSPFHKTINMRLGLLTRGMGLAYFAFTPPEEFELILEMLRKSSDPEDAIAKDDTRVRKLVDKVRAQGYASRVRHVEPRNSNTIAVPIMNESQRVVASLGLTYFTSAFPEAEACERYVPVLQKASTEITQDLARIKNSFV